MKRLLLSRRGGEYVEAAFVLPMLVLIMISFIWCTVFFYGRLECQCEMHTQLLDEADRSTALITIKRTEKTYSSLPQGLVSVALGGEIRARTYVFNEAELIRTGRIADGLFS